MIKSAIRVRLSHHYDSIENYKNTVYVVDYTNKTKSQKGVVFFSPKRPLDIESFEVLNNKKLSIDCIPFNRNSFTYGDANSRSHCESVIFPEITKTDSWVLFCELKYSSRDRRNGKNITKAIKQLYRTQYYYKQHSVITQLNTCYIIMSLPLQTEPFSSFRITQPELTNLKKKRNIVLRLKNSVEIMDDKVILV